MSFLTGGASWTGNPILVPGPHWLRGTGDSGDENELVIKRLTHINILSAFIAQVAKQEFRRKAHAHFFFARRDTTNGRNWRESNCFKLVHQALHGAKMSEHSG